MLVVRTNGNQNDIHITAAADGIETVSVSLKVI